MWGWSRIALLTFGVFVWVGTPAVGKWRSSDRIGKLVKNLEGKSLGTIKDLVGGG